MIYFLTASGIPLVKIGRSDRPAKRLSSCCVWSPVPLHLAAVDEGGDHLTESELLYRFREIRSHGEWVFATPEVMALIAETNISGDVPGGWYLPDGYDDRRFASDGVRGPTMDAIKSAYGLSLGQIRSIVGSRHLVFDSLGLPMNHVPAMVYHLMAAGKIGGYLDFLSLRKPRITAQPVAI